MWFVIAVAQAGCPRDAAPELPARVADLESAFDAVDEEAFLAAALRFDDALACVRSELTGPVLAAVHRGRALTAYFDRELVASEKSWAAVKVLDPAFRAPDTWMAPGSELRALFDGAPANATRTGFTRVPAGGWKVDGQPSAGVPDARAFYLQGFDTAGALVHSDYHYSIATVPVVDFLRLDKTAQQRRRARMRWGGTLLAAALGGASVAYGLSAGAAAARVDDRSTPPGSLRAEAQRANRQSNTAVAFGLGALATGTVTWSVRW